MPRNVQTARGEVVDFDTLVIKQQLAQAPMNIEVERRKKFIDSKEGTPRGQRKPMIASSGTIDPEAFVTNEPTRATGQIAGPDSVKAPTAAEFEVEAAPVKSSRSAPVEAVPVIPDRKK